MGTEEKREVPLALRKILAVDVYLTDVFVKRVENFLPLQQLKVHYKTLEISCHGIVWFVTTLLLIWALANQNYYQLQVNLFIGLILDIILVAVLKALTRRRRPSPDTDLFSLGPDKYSFPSGHASRAAFIVYIFIYLWPVPTICVPPLLAWSFSVCMSRILMRRHHILDVLLGIVLGIFEGLLIGYMYLEKETCVNLISWITDEKMSGPEYDV